MNYDQNRIVFTKRLLKTRLLFHLKKKISKDASILPINSK